jgi:hypothetical protein
MGTKNSTGEAFDGKTARPANLTKKLHEKKASEKITTISRRTPAERLRIGALAWSQFERSEQRWLTDQELARSVALVSKKLAAAGASGITADIIICSGAAVWSDRRAKEDTLARELTLASGGIPVLVECKEDSGDPAEWYLANGGRWHLVRNCQHFSESKDTYSRGQEVLKELGSGFGRIRVESPSGGASAELVLLLCNEARLLQKTTAEGLFANIKKRPKPLPDPFHGEWFLLHPSHRPYANSRQAGVGLVASWYKPSAGANVEAVFAGATSGATYGDGSRAPRAIVHAGPFSPRRRSDRSVATIAFAGGKVVVPSTPNGVPLTIPGLVPIKYAEFEFPLDGTSP